MADLTDIAPPSATPLTRVVTLPPRVNLTDTVAAMDVSEVLDDLRDEQVALDAVVSTLAPEQWATPTPSPRWTVADQIGHLTYFDTTAALAITDPDGFCTLRSELVQQLSSDEAADDATLGAFRQLDPTAQLNRWRDARAALEVAARQLRNDDRVEWYGPSMSSKSFLTARLMEVWAHGQDICDAIDAHHAPTSRLRHIAQLGVITRGWSYIVRGEQAPGDEVRVELVAPGGDVWTWGDEAAPNSIRGTAEDFCLVVTQRRHIDDTDLTTVGESAEEWMHKAQAFAGRPTDGPAPRGAR